jgi:hypothetical protein
MGIIWVSRDEAPTLVRARVIDTEVVLDVGVGIQPQSYFRPHVHICVEPYLPYIERLRRDIGDDSTYVFLNCTWNVAMRILPSKSVDSVFALDVIEHLEKADGLAFLKEAERVARRQIMIYTPLGFYPQCYNDSIKRDRWGMDGGYWQAHRSGWYVEDFGEGWDFICCEAFHLVDQNEQLLEKPFGAIWAFRNLDQTNHQSTAGLPNHCQKELSLWLAFPQRVKDKLKRFVRLSVATLKVSI